MNQSSSARGHSTDQARETDVDVGDGEGWWGDSGIAVRGDRGKGVGGAGSDGGPTRLRENRDWLRLNG